MKQPRTSVQGHTTSTTGSLHTRPSALLVISVAVICLAEALVMVLLPHLKLQDVYWNALVDASLLSLIVVPSLYLLFFKPLRNNVLSLERSEKHQEQLRELDRLKSDFISIAAHELGTPVSVVMGYSELLSHQVESDTHKEYLGVIYQKALALERIINDLLDLNRLESPNTMHISREENDLCATIHNVVHFYRTRHPERQINLALPAQTLSFRYDHIRMSQVLDNLLSNAIKYSDSVHDEIDLSVSVTGKAVLITVKDEGIGMTREETRRIYDKFFRGDPKKGTVGGLGLGMSIVKSIIESHRGSIVIDSKRGVGTTVRLSLPIAA